MHKMEILLLL